MAPVEWGFVAAGHAHRVACVCMQSTLTDTLCRSDRGWAVCVVSPLATHQRCWCWCFFLLGALSVIQASGRRCIITRLAALWSGCATQQPSCGCSSDWTRCCCCQVFVGACLDSQSLAPLWVRTHAQLKGVGGSVSCGVCAHAGVLSVFMLYS